jgi:ribosomal protein S18 acetylase RimI-like enzyme
MSGPSLDLALVVEVAGNATATHTVQLLDGWLLRADAELPFRRSNCVLTGGGPARRASDEEVERKLALVEDFYGSRGLVPRFQLDPTTMPADLDARLGERGYVIEAPTELLVAQTHAVVARLGPRRGPGSGDVEVQSSPALGEGWVASYREQHGADDDALADRLAAYERLLRGIGPRSVAVTAAIEDVPAGVAFGVVERGWLGVFGMSTAPALRRQGVAVALLRALADTAEGEGIGALYLQVEVENEPAQRLYRTSGFLRGFGYHYRSRFAA